MKHEADIVPRPRRIPDASDFARAKAACAAGAPVEHVVVVGQAHEQRLVTARREEHTAVEHPVEEPGVAVVVGELRTRVDAAIAAGEFFMALPQWWVRGVKP